MHGLRLSYALLIAAGYLDLVTVAEDLVCSRFHYEEQFLEKVIRLEIKVEQVVKEINEWMRESEKKAAESKQELTESLTKLVEEKIENNLHSEGGEGFHFLSSSVSKKKLSYCDR